MASTYCGLCHDTVTVGDSCELCGLAGQRAYGQSPVDLVRADIATTIKSVERQLDGLERKRRIWIMMRAAMRGIDYRFEPLPFWSRLWPRVSVGMVIVIGLWIGLNYWE